MWLFTLTSIISALALGYWGYNVVYSLFFSPLRKIPSPLIFQLLPIYFDYYVAIGDPFILERYHAKYGPVFRIGWTLVVFVDADAINKIYGTYKLEKAKCYSILNYFGNNMFLIRDRQLHRDRKKLLLPAFTKSKVAAMESVIIEKGLLPLMDNFRHSSNAGKPIDIFHQFHYMSWDIIGELAFGETFDMLVKGEHPAVEWLSSVLKYSIFTYTLPILKFFPCSSGIKLKKFAVDTMDRYYKKRQTFIDQKEPIPDTLIENFVSAVDPDTGDKLSKDDIMAEALLLLFAGTDTSSNALSFFFYLLMKNQKAMSKVQSEVLSLGVEKDHIIDYELCKSKLVYLEAALKESMRILPTIPGALFREIPKEGAIISGYYLPPGTDVCVPILPIHRSTLIWENPEEFIPERWLDKDTDTKAFIPFITGPRACIGRDLAWMEMMVVSANIFNRYSLSLLTPEVELVIEENPILRPTESKIMVNVTTL